VAVIAISLLTKFLLHGRWVRSLAETFAFENKAP